MKNAKNATSISRYQTRKPPKLGLYHFFTVFESCTSGELSRPRLLLVGWWWLRASSIWFELKFLSLYERAGFCWSPSLIWENDSQQKNMHTHSHKHTHVLSLSLSLSHTRTRTRMSAALAAKSCNSQAAIKNKYQIFERKKNSSVFVLLKVESKIFF